MNDRVVQLLIPADAKRTSGNTSFPAGAARQRYFDKKILMKRKNSKKPGRWSMRNFVYRKGQWVEVTKILTEDRWMDSTTGFISG